VSSASFLTMSTRLSTVVVDAADPEIPATFWATLLDWRLTGTDVTAPPDDGWESTLRFTRSATPRTVKNRLHLDLSSAAPDHQAAIVARALSLGATRIDVGQRNVPWIVLADPVGNEFCVLEPRPEYADTGAVAAVVVDAVAPLPLAEFWSATIGWPLVGSTPGSASLRSPHGRGPWLEFVHTGEPHAVANRVRLGVAVTEPSTDVARLVELGARKVEVGTGLMADPEGNEFRVLPG
jgi:glyoxalase superfamily protein